MVMIVHNGLGNILLKSPVVTLGIFDGVHLGHRALLEALVTEAEKSGGESVVMTFYPHPKLVLSGSPATLYFLSTLEEKKRLLENAGIGHLVIIEFNHNFSNISACDFIKKILIGKIGARHLIVGHNHHFGKRGKGDFATIEECAGKYDLKIERIDGVKTGDGYISSSRIREALLNGSLEKANSLLGYCYQLSGTIVEGRHLGKSIGFPTANIEPADPHKLVPCDGVYAVETIIEGKLLKGMLSIGYNPTVSSGSGKRTIEVHIFDFDKEIYGKEIIIIFRFRMRDEKRFSGLDPLAAQMILDKQQAIRMLSEQ